MGENRLLLIIALGGMALTLGMCTMSGAGTATGSSTFNGCIGHTHKFEVKTACAFDIRLKWAVKMLIFLATWADITN